MPMPVSDIVSTEPERQPFRVTSGDWQRLGRRETVHARGPRLGKRREDIRGRFRPDRKHPLARVGCFVPWRLGRCGVLLS